MVLSVVKPEVVLGTDEMVFDRTIDVPATQNVPGHCSARIDLEHAACHTVLKFNGGGVLQLWVWDQMHVDDAIPLVVGIFGFARNNRGLPKQLWLCNAIDDKV